MDQLVYLHRRGEPYDHAHPIWLSGLPNSDASTDCYAHCGTDPTPNPGGGRCPNQHSGTDECACSEPGDGDSRAP